MTQRQYHLGLDWGTSATKLVLRDYGQRKAFVLYLDSDQKIFRYPSTVACKAGRFFFGFEAEQLRGGEGVVTHDALKAKIYSNKSDSNPSEEEEIATLYLAHIISRAYDFAELHASRENSEALMGMTLGIPAEELEQTPLRNIYERIARTAYEIAVRIGADPQREKIDDSRQALKLAREQIKNKSAKNDSDKAVFARWLRPELAAAMYWGVKSPTIQSGLYSCVDIGAWTTNASYFRLHGKNFAEKDAISFYGGACRPPGMIDLLGSVGASMGKKYSDLIGREQQLSLKQNSKHVDQYRRRYFEVWQEGFRKSYLKEKRQSAWEGKLNVMVVGGGAKINSIKDTFHKTFPHEIWEPPKPVPNLGCPSDLYEFPKEGILAESSFSGDSTFLLVAYGLSVHSGDFPVTTLAPQVPPLPPEKRPCRFKPFDEIGYDK